MAEVSRRQALAGLGTVSLSALIAACSDDEPESEPARTTAGERSTGFDDARTCRVTAEQTEGPFYFDVDEIRSDIREDREGAELRLGVRVRDAEACEPLPDAVVDIWHCDAEGSYSAEPDTYLRGAQVTNRDGVADFTTIYPGWYPGRTIHIHAKVHLDRTTVLTTQLYFDDTFSARVFTRDEAYPGESNRDGFNASDGIYDERLELTLSEQGDAYSGRITLDVERA
jgi:protocatechuate 3,4-dioxygenase beta subunit